MSKRKKNMGPRKWTTAQKDYLRSLLKETDANGNPFPRQVVVVFLNKKFPTRPRTLKGVEAMSKILRDEDIAEELAAKIVRVKPKPKKIVLRVDEVSKPKKTKKRKMVETSNSGKTWTHADDRYLIQNWSAIDSVQSMVTEKLVRSISGCTGRMYKIKKDKEYYHKLIGNISDHHHHPHPVPGKPGLMERLLTWLVNRRANKQAKKVEKLQRQLAEMGVKNGD